MEEKEVDTREKWEWMLHGINGRSNIRDYFLAERDLGEPQIMRICRNMLEGKTLRHSTIKSLWLEWLDTAKARYWNPSPTGIPMANAMLAIVYTEKDTSKYPVFGEEERKYQGTLFLWKTADVEKEKGD